MRPVVQLWSRVCLALVNRSSCPRSRSVSAPSSVTYTSPCWYGLIVPGSTFRYGSHFWRVTRRPRLSSRQPIDAAATPLPREETTPPVTNIYFGPIGSVPAANHTRVRNWVYPSRKMSAYNVFYGESSSVSTWAILGNIPAIQRVQHVPSSSATVSERVIFYEFSVCIVRCRRSPSLPFLTQGRTLH